MPSRFGTFVGLGAVLLLGACTRRAVVAAPGAASRLPSPTNLVKQANAPISNVFQLRFQNAYVPRFTRAHGEGNVATVAVTMPVPAYRLLPVPQLSLLTTPVAVTAPDGTTGFGDVRFVDIGLLEARPRVLVGAGPVLVFPSATRQSAGQGKWQIGPAAAVAYSPARWLLGALVQNPVSVAGDRERKHTSALFVQPFATFQLGNGWFARSQPQIAFSWRTRKAVVPIDLGFGRVFRIAGRNVSCFVEPFWNASTDGPTPTYGVLFGFSLLYPEFWTRSTTSARSS